jgi:hypothetical protein
MSKEMVYSLCVLQLRMDPSLFFTFDVSALLRTMPSMRSHLLMLRGERSMWAGEEDMAIFVRLAEAAPSAAADTGKRWRKCHSVQFSIHLSRHRAASTLHTCMHA